MCVALYIMACFCPAYHVSYGLSLFCLCSGEQLSDQEIEVGVEYSVTFIKMHFVPNPISVYLPLYFDTPLTTLSKSYSNK